jgi:hypothetical protein
VTSGAFQTTITSDASDAFVTKLNSAGLPLSIQPIWEVARLSTGEPSPLPLARVCAG